MSHSDKLWVLGHQIRLMDTDDSYGMVEVTSPPGVPGPPPHFHTGEKEFFLIISGVLDVMIDGIWQSCSAGRFLELSEGSVHTFINNASEDAVWLTGWRPKGFERFFAEFGVADGEQAAGQSVDDAIVGRVIREAPSFGMNLVND